MAKRCGWAAYCSKALCFDAGVVPRPRIGFDRLSAEMPFFKESTYIDEELRQQLNMVLETENTAYIDSVLNRVFNDEVRLIEAARARREMMRMMDPNHWLLLLLLPMDRIMLMTMAFLPAIRQLSLSLGATPQPIS